VGGTGSSHERHHCEGEIFPHPSGTGRGYRQRRRGGEENQDLPGERAPGREEVMEVMEVMEDHVKERANTVVGNPREEESKEKV